jgi:thioredoxin 1
MAPPDVGAPWWDAPAATVTGCVVPRRDDGRRPRITAAGEGEVTAVLTPEALDEATRSTAGGAAVVAFEADWCAPCVRFRPKFELLCREYGGEVAFASVNVDALDDAAVDRVGVETVPTFVLFRDAREVHRIVGLAHKRPARAIANAIKRYLLV